MNVETENKLELPEYNFKVKYIDNKKFIFDKIRKRYVRLTSEEWVRQNFLMFLIEKQEFPQSLIMVEKVVELNGIKQRCDIVAFNNRGEAIVIVECKAPTVKITQDAFDQIARYNMNLQVATLIVTNGLEHYCCKIDYINRNYSFIQEIPFYKDL